MVTISATYFRNHLFEFLDRVSEGEMIVIQRNRKEVARLVSPIRTNWRNKVKVKPKLLVDSEEIIKPMDDIWEEYV